MVEHLADGTYSSLGNNIGATRKGVLQNPPKVLVSCGTRRRNYLAVAFRFLDFAVRSEPYFREFFDYFFVGLTLCLAPLLAAEPRKRCICAKEAGNYRGNNASHKRTEKRHQVWKPIIFHLHPHRTP